MGPLSFLNGAFLAALAAAVLPILIHLFSRRRLREVPFSNLAFLDEVTRRKTRRMRMRQWLLLALRTLAIAFIALALSRPVWQGGGAGLRRGSSTMAILLDDSFSMEARLDPDGLLPVDAAQSGLEAPTRFAQARRRAREALALLEEGDRAVLVFMAAPVQIPYGSTVRDPALLLEELERARPRPARADLAGALEQVYPLLSAATTLNREVLIISDFQQNQADEMLGRLGARTQAGGDRAAGGGGSGDDDDAPGMEPRSVAPDSARYAAGPARLPVPEQTRLYLLPVSTEASSNVALSGALYEKDPAGRGGRLTVRLNNLGDDAAGDVTIQALGGGETGALLGEGVVDLEAGSAAQTVIALVSEPEQGLLTVRATPDLLERDDVRFVVTTATSRFRVLLVTGDIPAAAAIRDEARFVVLALDPWAGSALLGEGAGADAGSAGEARLFEIEMVAEADLGLRAEIDADAVVLLNVGRLSATAVERLEIFQQSGGGLLIALGDRVDTRMYNEHILPRLCSARLENIETQRDGTGQFALRPAVVGHALFAGFPIAPGGALTSAHFRTIVQLRPGDRSRILAEFSGGRPALIEEPGLLLFASALDIEWSDFPTSASFLPFLHRAMLQLILGGRAGQQQPVVGDALSWPVPRSSFAVAFRCQGPDGTDLPVSVVQTDRGPLLLSEPVPEPGFYHLNSASAPSGPDGEPVAVNVDVRESDLRVMRADQMDLLFGEDVVHLAAEGEISRQILETRYGRELWRLCLVLAFGLLLAESLIARGRVLS